MKYIQVALPNVAYPRPQHVFTAEEGLTVTLFLQRPEGCGFEMSQPSGRYTHKAECLAGCLPPCVCSPFDGLP